MDKNMQTTISQAVMSWRYKRNPFLHAPLLSSELEILDLL